MRKEDKKITSVEIQNKYILKYAKGPIEYSDDVKAALKSVFQPKNRLDGAAPPPKKTAQTEKQVPAAPAVKVAEKVGANKPTTPVEKQAAEVIPPKPFSVKIEAPIIHAEMEILLETVAIIPAQNEGEEETPPPSPPPFDPPNLENETTLLPHISTKAGAPPPSPLPLNLPQPEKVQALAPQVSAAAPPPPPPPPQNFSKKIGSATTLASNPSSAAPLKTPEKSAAKGKSFIDELREKQAKKNSSIVQEAKTDEKTPKAGMASVQKPRRASPLDRFKKIEGTPEKVAPSRSSSAAPSAPQNSRGFLAAITNQGKHLRSPEESDDDDEDESPRQSAGK